MKKTAAIILTLSILFAFAACSSKEYVDVVVTKPVTDTNGENVTDSSGEIVYEVVTDENGKTVTTSVDKSVTNEKDIAVTTVPSSEEKTEAEAEGTGDGGSTTKKQSDKTTAKQVNGTTKKQSDTSSKTTTKKNGASDKTTTKSTTTTTEPTTKRPKKRKVFVNVKLPYYNGVKTTMTVSYKVEGDDEFTRLDPQDIVMDKAQTIECELGKLKGDVTVKVTVKGIELTNNSIVIKSTSDGEDQTGTITVVTGIEAMQGEND